MPSVLQHWRGAFVLTPSGLRAIDHALMEFLQDPSTQPVARDYTIVIAGQEPRREQNVDAVAAYRNPRSAPVAAIIVSGNQGVRWARVVLDSDGRVHQAAITLSARGESVDSLSALAGALSDEAANLATWYSPGRRCLDSSAALLTELPAWSIKLCMSLVAASGVVVISYSVYTAIRAARWRSQAERALADFSMAVQSGAKVSEDLVQKVEPLRKTLEQSSPTATWVALGTLLVMIVVGLLAPGLIGNMFPRLEFAIGEGKDRHERVRSMRNYVLGTVVVSGIAIPLVRTWWWGR